MTFLGVRIDGIETAPDEAAISVLDDGLLRGDGVFEAIRVYSGLPFELDDHLERMRRSADGMRLQVDVEAIRADATALATQSNSNEGVIRVIATAGGRRIALLESAPPLPNPVSLATVTFAPSRVLDGLKTLSYGANALAARLAVERGADRALLVHPDGRVLEGPTFAFFVSLSPEGPLETPPLSAGILDSITRRFVKRHCEVVERPLHVDELNGVHEAFIASTVCEILPVGSIDDVPVSDVPGYRTSRARQVFDVHTRGHTPRLQGPET